jgi:hypothetical protein
MPETFFLANTMSYEREILIATWHVKKSDMHICIAIGTIFFAVRTSADGLWHTGVAPSASINHARTRTTV